MSGYKPGDPPPTGYIEWHAWADAQAKAGLRQKWCLRCKRYHFPQEVAPSCKTVNRRPTT